MESETNEVSGSHVEEWQSGDRGVINGLSQGGVTDQESSQRGDYSPSILSFIYL